MIEIITEADYKDRLAATQNGVLLFFKKLCPHCKNMEKVLEKFGAAKSGIALYGIDIEENAAAAAALGAEIGCTRPVAEEEHWYSKDRYIGVSGVMIKPNFYLAIGISGQIQHMVGVNQTNVICAINKDENAPHNKAGRLHPDRRCQRSPSRDNRKAWLRRNVRNEAGREERTICTV